MIIADDGGAQVSTDAGESWTTYHNQPTAQFYRIATDDHFPYRIYGAQQDNSSIRIRTAAAGGAITERDWEVTAGGESAYHAIDPTITTSSTAATTRAISTASTTAAISAVRINVYPD